MDRLAKLTSNLYPRWWRERYGEEFAALLEDSRPGLGASLDILKGALSMRLFVLSGKRILLSGAVAGLAIGFASAFFLTPLYASHTIISIRTPDANSDVGGRDSIKLLSDRALSPAALTEIMDHWELYPQERTTTPKSALLEKFKHDIRISAAPPTAETRDALAFELTFIYPDRLIAQRVVNHLGHRFLVDNVRLRVAALQILTPANVPAEPMFPNQRNMAVGGLAIGSLTSALAAAILHLRRKRETA